VISELSDIFPVPISKLKVFEM